jgi:hypothetical protein
MVKHRRYLDSLLIVVIHELERSCASSCGPWNLWSKSRSFVSDWHCKSYNARLHTLSARIKHWNIMTSLCLCAILVPDPMCPLKAYHVHQKQNRRVQMIKTTYDLHIIECERMPLFNLAYYYSYFLLKLKSSQSLRGSLPKCHLRLLSSIEVNRPYLKLRVGIIFSGTYKSKC